MGLKEANCLLLWAYQGGRVNAKGQPISEPGNRASGYCDTPDDCFRCPLMQQELARQPPGQANWVCPACLKEVSRIAKSKGISIYMTGHYTEGQCQFVGCVRPARMEYDGDDVEDQPWSAAEYVEKPRGFSRFLQLIIGDINT